MRSFSELVASISWSTVILARDSSLLRKLQLGNSRSSFEIPFGQGILHMHPRGEITRNCHATWVQVRIPKACVVIDMRLILSSRLFLLAFSEKQGKRYWLQWLFAPTDLNSFFSQNPRHHHRFLMVLSNFLNHCVVLQDLVEPVDNQKRFQEYSYYHMYFAAFQFRG